MQLGSAGPTHINERLCGLTETTETPEQYDFSTDPHGYTREDVLGVDFYLDEILRMSFGNFNDSENTFGLTFTLDGALVSGIAISAKSWNRLMSESLGEAHSALGEHFAEMTGELAASSREVVQSRIDDDRPLAAYRFIHMRDVRITAGGITQFVPLWRAQVSKVSGWSIGSTNTPEEARVK
jgi:hypothetical protein